MNNLRNGVLSSIGEFPINLSVDFFETNKFTISNVNTKTFILLLASAGPLSFVSGQPVDLASTLKEANRSEFHHMMPRSFLKGKKDRRLDENVLANFSFLSRSDNRDIGGVAPSIYRVKMPEDLSKILERAFTSELLFSDNFEKFVADRADRLASAAASLCQVS